ncbi:uncharacterized protein BDV17DRAFT_281683 [Aspergillus undulatus]|uniref:uncharacterized protein n=1 Tax=Aspergillus undulatus TaxID=1810928 RepID=UPI003CCE008E
MPRRFELNRNGERPICAACRKSARDCRWSQVPEIALRDPRIAGIFRHYMTKLAGWYDLNDSRRHFEDVDPVRALHNPLLLSAILAFAAGRCHRTPRETKIFTLISLSFYHYDSVRRLIELTKNVDELPIGETVAALCLSRSYETITREIYSLLSTRYIQLTADLTNITVALIEQRSLMIALPQNNPFALLGDGDVANDADYANSITFILGQIIIRCLSIHSPALGISEWERLKSELETRKSSLPSSFNLPETPGLRDQGGISSIHYYHTAMSILQHAEPSPPDLSIVERMANMSSPRDQLDHHATQVCALTLSSDSAPVWVDAFGPIGFSKYYPGGPWLQNSSKRTEIKKEVERW